MSNGAQNRLTPREEALGWWQDRVESGRYVGARGELPSASAMRYLRTEGLLAETPGGWGWVIQSPDNADALTALRQNYWPLVGVFLGTYAPAALERTSAVRLHMGESSLVPVLYAVHGSSSSERKVEVAPGQVIALRPAADDLTHAEAIDLMEVGDVSIPILSRARTLLSLTLGDVRDNRDLVLTWLRSLLLARPELEEAYNRTPRHVLLARFGHLAEEIGNRRLASQISELLTSQHRNSVSRTHTGVGAQLVVPRYIVSQPSLREAWADRFCARLARAAEVTRPAMEEALSRVAALPRPEVLRRARDAKVEDTYHSTTIEGYRIAREDVRAVMEGRSYKGRSPHEIERLMALSGYSQAFERTLELIADSPEEGRLALTEGDLIDLHVELWGPSIDAGVVRVGDLRGWRGSPVYIRGSNHVPAGDAKIPTLMRILLDELNGIEADPITRAAVMHWGFVHVHPFMDGNGRISRLLMNLLLCAAGIPWTTIRGEEKDEYFRVLEAAHVDEEYQPFAIFIRDRVLRAAGL